MTDSATASRPPKRERLVESARDLLYEQGVQRTTLAQIAERADVPVGNVYYYYKTRDELVHAVIESRLERMREVLGELDRRSSPKARLKALTSAWTDEGAQVAEHGCPLGGLVYELNKDHSPLSEEGAQLMRELVDWSERQFRELGRRDAATLAFSLISSIQGAALLTNTFHDESLFRREVRRLGRWIDSI